MGFENFRCANAAVLALDFTQYIADNFVSDDGAAVENAARLCSAAGKCAVSTIFVLPGELTVEGVRPKAGSLHPRLQPGHADKIFLKSRIGAFSSTPLDAFLRSKKITTLIITGIATSGTVLSTARWAYDVGYDVIVASDCCSDPDPDVHMILTSKEHDTSWLGLWRIATIVSLSEAIELLASG